MPQRGRTRRRDPCGPAAVPIPSCFRKHHARLSPFARSHVPPRMPVLGSVAKLQALSESQLDELCEDVVVALPLWAVGLPAHTFYPGPAIVTHGNGMTTLASPISTIPSAGVSPFVATTTHTTPTSSPLSSLPSSGANTPTESQAIQVTVQTLPGVPPPSHHPSHGAHPPANLIATGTPYQLELRHPTEADAIALAPNVPIWLRGAPKKRNESRVKLARSFMAGFEGMKALVWDVTLELERRWPLREEEV